MRVVVSANGTDLDGPLSPTFGRCPNFIFVDTDTMESEGFDNTAAGASGGAGIQAAQYVLERGAQAVLSGSVGPNAFEVLESAGVPVYPVSGGTVREAVISLKEGALEPISGASAESGAGVGGSGNPPGGGPGGGLGGGPGTGPGAGAGRGLGGGAGLGLGGGRGRGRGMGRGRRAGLGGMPPATDLPAPGGSASASTRDIQALKETVDELRRRLDDVVGRIELLEGKE